jgi:hypothetical protein
VKGARIKGGGFIEVGVVSNTGRTFIYEQQSVNGEFVVPYSTSGNPYDVKTITTYHIIGTGPEQQYEVTEKDVMEGLIVK